MTRTASATLAALSPPASIHGTGTVRDLHDHLAGRIYIHEVTQLEISSTDVRALISAGRDPRYLMPEGVRKIIMESGCYARKDVGRG